MAVRPIDAVQVLHDINLHHRPTPVSEFESGFNNGLNQAMWEITHAPTLTQPNEPLTLEELREMDGEPVWFDTIKRWGIVKVCKDGTFIITKSGEFEVGYITQRKYYRRPPEGEEETE